MGDLTGVRIDQEHGQVDERAVFHALPRAVVVTDPAGDIILWNRPAEELYGWPAGEVLGRPAVEVLQPRYGDGEPDGAVDPHGEWDGDLVVRCRNGTPLRVRLSCRPVLDQDGTVAALVGSSEDVTGIRLLQHLSDELNERLQLALDAGRLGTWVWDQAGGAVQWDARLEALFGLEPGTFDGRFDTYVGLLHPGDVDQVLRRVEEAVRDRSRYLVEHRVLWPDGTVHWLAGAGQVTLDEAGEPTGTIGCVADITERVESERERQRLTIEALAAAEDERVSRERLEFLGRINDALNEAGDQTELMQAVVAAAVPRLGDWCAIFVLPDDERIPAVEIAHVDPEMVAYAHLLREQFPYDPDAEVGIAPVIRTGVTQFLPDIDDTVLDDAALTADERAVVRGLALRSAIAIPLMKRGRVLGAMQFVMSESSRRYTQDDVTLARAVGSRIASSLENRSLAERQRVIAATLQASLLPDELPDVPGVEIAVRYWATGEGTEVGGDFYDVFPVADGTWGLVIGDVCGTGPAAAALTGLARHTIASAAWHGDAPAAVVRHLNRTLRARRTDSFCTVAYAALTPTDAGATVTLTGGGHPLPVLVDADGAAAAGSSGTLIGVFDEIGAPTTTLALGSGDWLVFYTDGVTDVPPPHQLEPDDFAAMVGEEARASATADELADRLHARLEGILEIDRRSDDIALMILRVTPARWSGGAAAG
jgi:PAS domain S-box-containing protein